MSEHLNALLDPRGYQERPMLELAKRPTLEELKQGRHEITLAQREGRDQGVIMQASDNILRM